MSGKSADWAAALSTAEDLEDAIAEATASVATRVGNCDLAFLFVSGHDAPRLGQAAAAVASELGGEVLGATAGGVLAAGQEREACRAVSLLAGSLGDAHVHPFALSAEAAASFPEDPAKAMAALRLDAEPRALLLLGEPFSLDASQLLLRLDRALPQAVKVGGMASGGRSPGDHALWVGGRIRGDGLVGLALDGAVSIESIVAQGCRPIGQPMFVTRATENLIQGLDGRTPASVLEDLWEAADMTERRLLRGSLFLGLVMTPQRDQYAAGDFLVRNLVGMDVDSGALAVAAQPRAGDVVQFHLRDRGTSAADLESQLRRAAAAKQAPDAVLSFSCLGRGEGLYGEPDFESRLIQRILGDLPTGGFFCNGEIGPVGGTTFLHGYTSALALLRGGS